MSLVIVGRIRRSHGVHGVVVVEPLTAGAGDVFIQGREFLAGTTSGETLQPERVLTVEMVEPFQGGYRVQFAEIADRTEADRWRDRCLLAPRDTLPAPDEGALYLHDLLGLRVIGREGMPVGTVEAWYELPHDVMLEVARPGGAVMIPYRFVTGVDLERGVVEVDPPEGLL